MKRLFFYIFISQVFALNEDIKCEVSYKFSKICKFYNVDSPSCDKLNLSSCEVTKTSYKERKCPTYFCVKVIFLNWIKYEI